MLLAAARFSAFLGNKIDHNAMVVAAANKQRKVKGADFVRVVIFAPAFFSLRAENRDRTEPRRVMAS